ncbi:AraC family transcriptional regulator [Edaphobacter sp. HDX4]|uniref:AraC family transcriptional regulator n=1 Tax=Edaphobacter sp. HDX4 TaxID=2794064 RepID=UPI002FE56D20
MHETYSAFPRPELKPYVRAYAQRRIDKADSAGLIEPVPACLEQILNFEFGVRPIAELGDASRFTIHRLSVVGASAYRPFTLHLAAGVESFAIFLQPLALWQLFRLPLSSLANHDYDGYTVLGEEGHQLWQRIAEVPAFEERVKLAESYLLRKALNAQPNTSIKNAAVYMFRAKGARPLEDVAGHLSLGLRQFERNFLREIGLSPKFYSRVARFQATLDARIYRQDTRWADLANEFGYHDQMHMIKDFEKLSGLSPERLLSQIGDMRPPAH